MKKTLLILLAAITAGAAGCAKNGSAFGDRKPADVGLFDGASPENSALSLYKYDGGETEVLYLYDADTEREIIRYLEEIPLYEADISEMDGMGGAPAYALSIFGAEGERSEVTWIGSRCVDETGAAYLADMDGAAFEKLLAGYPWESSGDSMAGNHLPNRYYLANRGEWVTEYLNKAKELVPHGITLEITAHEGSALTAKITNITDEEGGYPEYFAVQAMIGGEWYDIPPKEDMAFIDIAWLLPAGESTEKRYDYSWYGDLPEGRYRLVVEGAAAEFDIIDS